MNVNRRHLLAMLAGAMTPGALSAQGLDMRPRPKPASDPGDLVARSGLHGRVAYALMDGSEPLALRQASARMAPASTMKALTAIYALDRLGADYRFQTRVIRAGDTLILVGGGDPVLSTDDLAKLADDLVARGKDSPARFVVWGGALPYIPEIADEQADHLAYNPAISGMILNFNRVYMGWTRAGADQRISMEARAARSSPRAYTITAMPGDHRNLFTYRQEGGREYWTVSRAAMGRPGSRWMPVRLPELYAADVFQTLCRARGLVLPQAQIIDQLPQGQAVAQHNSPPVSELIRDMLRYSTNLTAEVLGLRASGAEDLMASGRAMQDWLGALGQGMQLADHSGLSEISRISPYAMAQILSGPGRDLRLAPLLRQNPLSDDIDGIRAQSAAKTGTLNFVSNLAGYVTAPSGAQGVFAIFCADLDRRQASIGQELPAGVSTWTRKAKILQGELLDSFSARLT